MTITSSWGLSSESSGWKSRAERVKPASESEDAHPVMKWMFGDRQFYSPSIDSGLSQHGVPPDKVADNGPGMVK